MPGLRCIADGRFGEEAEALSEQIGQHEEMKDSAINPTLISLSLPKTVDESRLSGYDVDDDDDADDDDTGKRIPSNDYGDTVRTHRGGGGGGGEGGGERSDREH